MIYLLFAVFSSALISIIMRLSTNTVGANIGMLAVNYLTCLVIAGAYAGFSDLLPHDPALPRTMALGAVQGGLYLLNFVLLQVNIRKSGVVLPSVFMKLGLLVSLVVSIFLFGELPTAVQVAGFCICIGAIVVINLQKDASGARGGLGLVVLLLTGGCADVMSKVYEQTGKAELAPQFLFYTFAVALVLCLGLMLWKKQRPGKTEVIFGLLVGIPNFFSARFLLRALQHLPAVVVYPSFSVGTILVVTLTGVAVFRERLEKRQWLAVAAIAAALVMLNV